MSRFIHTGLDIWRLGLLMQFRSGVFGLLVQLHSQDMVGLGQTESAVNRVPVSPNRAQYLHREKQTVKS